MMRRLALAVIAVLLALTAPALAGASDKSIVSVVFALNDPHYTDEFTDDELVALRARRKPSPPC